MTHCSNVERLKIRRRGKYACRPGGRKELRLRLRTTMKDYGNARTANRLPTADCKLLPPALNPRSLISTLHHQNTKELFQEFATTDVADGTLSFTISNLYSSSPIRFLVRADKVPLSSFVARSARFTSSISSINSRHFAFVFLVFRDFSSLNNSPRNSDRIQV